MLLQYHATGQSNPEKCKFNIDCAQVSHRRCFAMLVGNAIRDASFRKTPCSSHQAYVGKAECRMPRAQMKRGAQRHICLQLRRICSPMGVPDTDCARARAAAAAGRDSVALSETAWLRSRWKPHLSPSPLVPPYSLPVPLFSQTHDY